MAIIYSYPLNQPKRDDLLIGTITYDEDAVNPVHGNPTVSFTIGSLLDLVSGQGNIQNLQQVTNIGNTTTNSIIVSNSLKVSGGYYDSSNQPGSLGQLLSSTATGTQWVNTAQGVTSVGLSMPAAFIVTNSPITQTGTLTVTGAGTTAQYINGLGNLVTFPTIPTQYVLPVATTVTLGGIKIGYTEVGKNYPLELDNEKAYVYVPWTDTIPVDTGVVESVEVVSGVASYDKEVTIPNTATSIANNGFESRAITTLTLNTGLLTIGAEAFSINRLSGTLVIPPSVTTVGDYAFFGNHTTILANKITGLTLSGTNLATIGIYAFHDNLIAGTLIFPTSVTSIGANSFERNNLSGITIPDNCTVGDKAFFDIGQNSSSTTITLGAGVTLHTDCFANIKIPGSLTIPSSTIFASNSTGHFSMVYGGLSGTLTQINYTGTIYPDSIFLNQKLFALTLQNNSVVGKFAFASNPIAVLTIYQNVELKDRCFSDMPAGAYDLSLTIPGTTIFSVTGLGGHFQNSPNIVTVSVTGSSPYAITTMPRRIFFNCQNIASLNLSDYTITYDSFCFQNALASSITQITFGGAAKTFNSYSFRDNSLTAVTVPIGSTVDAIAFDAGVTITYV